LGNDPRFAVKLACRWVTPEQAAAYPTVELLQNPSMAAFRALYEWADFIAIPMRENIFSGITVALEAAALGTPILSARTGAIPTYFPDDAIFYYPVGDAEALRHIAASASVDERSKRAARARAIFLQQDYSTAALVRQYIAISRDIAPLSVGIRPDQPSGGRDVLDAAGADATA
jgi:glycosyltransferase involved in cell wall biosynthesis